ncbi:MAG TPA: RNA methyltransferase [Marmoricola sp.]|nr:RNA methyltransferase [Marmoricola sp.]
MASLPAPDQPLSSKSGRVKAARRLARRASRAEHRLFLAEGSKALTEALHLPGCVVEVFATEEAGMTFAALRHAVSDAGIAWFTVTDDALAALAGSVTPQGVVAVCRFVDVGMDALLEATALDGAPAPVVVCADVRDPGNAGTIIRTADAVAAAGVVLAGNSVDPYNDKTVRATVGSLFHLPLVLEPDPAAAVRQLHEAGRTVLAADGAGELDLFDAARRGTLSGPVAWLFGNEAWGLPEELAELADHRVAIPIRGRAESLNLSTAAAVCLYATQQATDGRS